MKIPEMCYDSDTFIDSSLYCSVRHKKEIFITYMLFLSVNSFIMSLGKKTVHIVMSFLTYNYDTS